MSSILIGGSMRKAVLEYLRTQRTGVLAVEMQDGSPHATPMHFAHCEGPFIFYFETNRKYRKAEAFQNEKKNRASLVLGGDESTMKIFQVDGTIEVISNEEKENFDTVYFGKFPEKKEKAKNNPDSLSFKFIPTWWKFSDFKHPDGKLVIESENIDVLNEDRTKTGEVRLIDDIHWYGLLHSSARIWIMNSAKEILLQHRDSSSLEHPDTWDASAAGHISAGDDSLGTALEEVKQEIGVQLVESDLKFLGTLKKNNVSSDGKFKDHSFEDIYLVQKDIAISDLVMERGEVSNLKWVPLEEFKKMVHEKDPQLVPHPEEYEFLLSHIG